MMKPYGEHAVRFDLSSGTVIPSQRRRLFDDLMAIDGVEDVILAETTGCVVFAPHVDRHAIARALLSDDGGRAPVAASKAPSTHPICARHVIQVVYDGEDLADLARTIGQTIDRVIAQHAEPDYRVAMLGFLPGFAYLRGLVPELCIPRRAEPRPRVPAGSVAMAAEYTGVYPFASPGGWHLLGRAVDFDPLTIGLAIGDLVRFESVAASSSMTPRVSHLHGEIPRTTNRELLPSGPHLEIVRVTGMAILVDGGRIGHMHEGVPRGGPLVRSAFRRANALAGNADDACAIEISGSIEVVARGGAIVIADAARRIDLAEDEHHTLSTNRDARALYLAIAGGGGVDAPMVLGGRGALLVANIGRLLKRGDVLVPRHAQGSLTSLSSIAADETNAETHAIAIDEGPDAAVVGLALKAMTNIDLRISPQSDRTGTRLDGWRGPLTRVAMTELRGPSAPMIKGAIELTPSGLIVFGPDHPTMGGYPVIAVLRDEDACDAFFSRPIGSTVRFAI